MQVKPEMTANEPHSSFTGNETYKTINPFLTIVGDFTLFYITVSICSVILGLLIILNIVCCCSSYTDYWLDRHTDNRWTVSIWSATPSKKPLLNFAELESQQQYFEYPENTTQYHKVHNTELNTFVSRLPLAPDSVTIESLKYLELHKQESDI
ncbi:uncharacterized protein LOC120636469 isoform X2 [Pararge aegeria]|nr:uncharacterized protein LOC120636469 isoform X2 [Pararge aegeria]